MDLVEARAFFNLFHNISETCFTRCVTHLYDRTLAKNEVDCVDTCLQKFLNVNNQCMFVFSELNRRNQEEAAKEQAAELLKQQQSAVAEGVQFDPSAVNILPTAPAAL